MFCRALIRVISCCSSVTAPSRDVEELRVAQENKRLEESQSGYCLMHASESLHT